MVKRACLRGSASALGRQEGDAAHGNVLVQTDADTADYRFPVAVYNDFTGTDVDPSVRCNALEDNCTIYHVVNGRRQAFLNRSVKVASGVWHTLRIEAKDDHFVVSYDGNKVLDAKDATFKEGGKVGLWTKAHSVIAFDDLSIAGR